MPAHPLHTRHLPDVVYVSAKNQAPKYHVTLECSALDHIRERDVDPADIMQQVETSTRTHGTLWFEKTPNRACRVCALELVAAHVLPRREDEPVAFASMTGQTPLEERALTGTGRFRRTFGRSSITEVTPSSTERLNRIAAAAHLPVVSTVAGPAMYGMVPHRALTFLRTNLRTSEPDDLLSVPTPEVVVLAWMLLCQSPPEIAAQYGADKYYDDAWELAMATAGA